MLVCSMLGLSEAGFYFYKIHQGDRYMNYSWTDTEYTNPPKSNSDILNRGTGCLFSGKNRQHSNPFTSKCWIGWTKKRHPNPFILIALDRVSRIESITLLTYVNQSMGAGPIKNITVKASKRLRRLQLVGHVCTPRSAYLKEPKHFEFHIGLKNLTAKFIKLDLQYSLNWILIRYLVVKKTGDSANTIRAKEELELTNSSSQCNLSIHAEMYLNDNDRMAFVIVAAVVGMVICCVLSLLTYYCRKRLRRLLTNQPKKSTFSFDNEFVDIVTLENFPDKNKNNDPYSCERSRRNNNEPSKLAVKDELKVPLSPTLTNIPEQEYSSFTEKDVYVNDFKTRTISRSSTKSKRFKYSRKSRRHTKKRRESYNSVMSSSLYSEYAVPCRIRRKKYKVISRDKLIFREQIGVGQFGEVHIAEATGLDDIYNNNSIRRMRAGDTTYVAVKTLKALDKNIETEFMKEVNVISQLTHENVVRLLGVCTEAPLLMVVEYMQNGDLNQFLKQHFPVISSSEISSYDANVLHPDALLYMIEQIASGMRYLHSKGFIHRDLATRNCLVGPAYKVKIADFGMSRYLHSKQYYRVEGQVVLPIRWMAPESILYGTFTKQTDIWSFGVMLWEILTFAREAPYAQLEDSDVICNAYKSVQKPKDRFPMLHQPEHCPDDIYDLMISCWDLNAGKRPSFSYLYKYFHEQWDSEEVEI